MSPEAPAAAAELRFSGPLDLRATLYAAAHPDAVPIGDANLPRQVTFALTGEADAAAAADDAQMLALLAPFAGFRGWVVRWIETAAPLPPRRAPRAALRPLPSASAGR